MIPLFSLIKLVNEPEKIGYVVEVFEDGYLVEIDGEVLIVSQDEIELTTITETI